VSSPSSPHPFLAISLTGAAGFWSPRAGRPPRDYIAKGQFFSRASTQKYISNSVAVFLILVNCVENHRKSEQYKANFVGFMVNYTTNFVILA
jgi:hypothetical protein